MHFYFPFPEPKLLHMTNDLPYRPCVGIVLTDGKGRIFTGERIDTPGAWQMPQGGIDDGENPIAAAFRELEEETGVTAQLSFMVAETPEWVTYDLPEHLIGKLWKGKFRGQKQKWFLMEFTGEDHEINIAHDHKEFGRWRWSTADEVLRDIVPFKKDVYAQVIAHFRERIEA